MLTSNSSRMSCGVGGVAWTSMPSSDKVNRGLLLGGSTSSKSSAAKSSNSSSSSTSSKRRLLATLRSM